MRRSLIMMMLWLVSGGLQAQTLYKCTDKQGKVEFSDRPCEAVGGTSKQTVVSSVRGADKWYLGYWHLLPGSGEMIKCIKLQDDGLALTTISGTSSISSHPYKAEENKIVLLSSSILEATKDRKRITNGEIVYEKRDASCGESNPGIKNMTPVAKGISQLSGVNFGARCGDYVRSEFGKHIVCRDMVLCEETREAERCAVYCTEAAKTVFPDLEIGPGSRLCQIVRAKK